MLQQQQQKEQEQHEELLNIEDSRNIESGEGMNL